MSEVKSTIRLVRVPVPASCLKSGVCVCVTLRLSLSLSHFNPLEDDAVPRCKFLPLFDSIIPPYIFGSNHTSVFHYHTTQLITPFFRFLQIGRFPDRARSLYQQPLSPLTVALVSPFLPSPSRPDSNRSKIERDRTF